MRILDLLDSYSSATAPTISGVDSNKLISYANDAAYESANGAPVGAEIYYNTTVDRIRFYNADTSAWEDVAPDVRLDTKANLDAYAATPAENGELVFSTDTKKMFVVVDGILKSIGGGVGLQEVPSGLVNGVNQDFDITSLPSSTESLMVFVDGILLKKTEYSFSTPTITLTVAPSVGQEVYAFYLSEGESASPVVAAGTNNVSHYQLTATDITNEYITLPGTPSVATDLLCWHVGVLQVYGTDYIVSSGQIDWSGRGMAGQVLENDIVSYQYFN